MTYHNIMFGLVAVMALFWLYTGTTMAAHKTGYVTNECLNNALAAIGNKIIGAIYVIGTLITLGILVK